MGSKSRRLVKIGELVDSISIKHKFPNEKIIFLNTSDVSNGSVINHSYSNVVGLPGQAKKSIQKNDILYSEIRPKNKRFAFIDFNAEEYVVSTKLMVLRVKSEREVLPRYLYHILSSEEVINYLQMIAESRSGTFPQITFAEMKNMEIELPNFEEQIMITKFLDDLEGKFSLNHQIISNLEQLSQTLFKRWFIDFEFPNENGEPYRSSGGKMMGSELGAIPIDWKISSVSEVGDILSGGTPKTKVEEYWNGSIPFYTPKDAGNSFYVHSTEKKITELGLTKCNSKLYPKNTIFITARGTVGKINLAGADMAMNQSCYALLHSKGHHLFLFLTLKTLIKQIIQSSNGAVFNAITVRDFNIFKFPNPNEELITKFETIVEHIFEQSYSLIQENQSLKELRDTILPKLLSGEIEIPMKSEELGHVQL